MLIRNSEVRRTFSVCKTERMVTVEQFFSDFFSIFFFCFTQTVLLPGLEKG